jgi:DNA-binding MarR family transcriptional regulator
LDEQKGTPYAGGMPKEPSAAIPAAHSGENRVCSAVDNLDTADLTWLMHRAADVLRADFDAVAKSAGLVDLRDWLVLAVVSDGIQRTQLDIARQLGIDKTTLIAILDRLETHGFIVRKASASDRRVRIPSATESGRTVYERVTLERDAAIAARMASVSEADQQTVRAALWVIAGGAA